MDFTESKYLRDIWNYLNEVHFANRLRVPAAIGWHDLEGQYDRDGHYQHRTNITSLSKKFEAYEHTMREVEKLPVGTKEERYEKFKKITEAEKLTQIVYLLLVHEIVHQADFQFNGGRGHSDTFVAIANKYFPEFGKATFRNARNWPPQLDQLLSDEG